MPLGGGLRSRALRVSLTFLALGTRSFRAAGAFSAARAAASGACSSRCGVRSGAAPKKPPYPSSRVELLAGVEALLLDWRRDQKSIHRRTHRSLCARTRSQEGSGAEGIEENFEGEETGSGSVKVESDARIDGQGRGGGDAGAGAGDGRMGKGRQVDNDRLKAERSRRIINTVDLLETLEKSEVNLKEVLLEFSSTLRDGDGLIRDERLIGEIARPVVARIRRYKTRDAYRRRQAAKRRGQELSPGRGAKALEEENKPFPTTAAEVDRFLGSTKVTVWDAVRAYQVLTPGERIRRQKIALSRTDPQRWFAERMEEEMRKNARRNDPAYLAEKREERRLSGIRRYETRRRNGNSGKGRPRSRADQRKAEELAAARAAAIAAGIATEADFAPPPKKVPLKDIPTVKRRRGRPRKFVTEEERAAAKAEAAALSPRKRRGRPPKVRTEEERAALALRKANGPRPVGRPRKLPLEPLPVPQPCHVTASLTKVVRAWMADAAAQAAEAAAAAAAVGSSGVCSVAPADLESHAKALAVSKTKEVTGVGPGGAWTPRMTRIALAGIEAWKDGWKEAFASTAAGAAADDAGADADAAPARVASAAAAAAAAAASNGEDPG